MSTPASRDDLIIEIKGNVFFSSQYLMDEVTIIKTKTDVENLVAQIIRFYADAGYPFCRIYPEITAEGAAIKKILLTIEEGERIKVADYIYDIQGKTVEGVVKKIMGLKQDNYFSSEAINDSKEKLLRMGVFEDINEHIVHRDGNYYVLFSLRERKSDYLTTFGSFGENDINFSINFLSLNLLGTLRQLQFHYEYQKLFALQFTEPILIFPASLNINFSLWTYDSVRLIQFNGRFIAPLGNIFNVSLLSGVESVSYPENNSDAQGHTNNVLGIGFGLVYDTFNLSFKQGINFEHLFRAYDRWKMQYDSEFIINKFILKTHYYVVETDSFEYFDYYRIGGAKDLRGYYDEEFIVSHAIWLNSEYKKFSIFPLFDVGLLNQDIQFSYGLGIEAKSRFADASLIIAWPKHGSWQDGKIHLMLEKGF